MTDKLEFNLVSPEGEVFSGAVDSVRVPASEGEFGALARHAPLMALIADKNVSKNLGGESVQLEVVADNITSNYQIEGGFVEVSPQGLNILAEKVIKIN